MVIKSPVNKKINSNKVMELPTVRGVEPAKPSKAQVGMKQQTAATTTEPMKSKVFSNFICSL